MQPPTEPTPAAPPQKPAPRGDEDRLYRQHHRDLHRAVARAVRAPRELIEDACQTAWAILLRTQPERYAIFAWLRVVAIHEAYRLSAIDRRDARLERLRPDDGDWHDSDVDRDRRLAGRDRPTTRSLMWRNCASRSGCWAPSRVLRLDCRL